MSLIDNMAENEKLLNELYDIYKKNFREHQNLWGRLAQEEQKHAEWLYQLAKEDDKSSLIAERRFSGKLIAEFNELIRNEIEKCIAGKVDSTIALKTALKIEETMLEKRFFCVLKSDQSKLSDTLMDLEYDTREHFEMLKKALEEDKWSKWVSG